MPEKAKIGENPAGERNRMSVYLAERALLDMVRQGNINYQSALQYSSGMSPGVPIEGKDPLRQMKTSVIVFTTLVSRAAMEGGLSPEVAYSLGDSYIQTAENSHDSGELSALAAAMYHDFIYRVHYLRANPNYSHAIQKCCDYIELSLDRKICAADLAGLVGYTEYYLTEKFKKETGKSVSEYIRQMKMADGVQAVRGVAEKRADREIFHELGEDADLEDISIDSTYIKAHKASAGAERGGGR